MKSPDDTVAQFARLRRLIVESFEAGDMETFRSATAEARVLLGTPNRASIAQKKSWVRRQLAKGKI